MDVTLFFLKAFWGTLSVSFVGFSLGFFSLGLVCVATLKNEFVRTLILRACKFFQAVPFLILLFWIHYGCGPVLEHFSLSLTPFMSGVLALAVSFLCFAGEMTIHTIKELKGGLLLSAEALSIRGWNLYRWVLFPELWARLKGAYGNLLLLNMKESALISTLGYFELTRSAQIFSELKTNYVLGIGVSLLLYWALGVFLEKTISRRLNA